MSSIASTSQTPAASNTLVGNSIEDLDLDVFLDLMLTQLQQQDPLNPMDNQEMLNTISQIREISANDHLSETLASVQLGQNVATATGLIGTEVEGITDEGRRVIGDVKQVAINDGEPLLQVNVEPTATSGDDQGSIEPGAYTYEIVWEEEEGAFSVEVEVDTEQLGEDFDGSIYLANLPKMEDGISRSVYRRRSDGSTEAELVGVLPRGSTTSFTDSKADSELDQVSPPSNRIRFRYFDTVEVRLSNIGNVKTLD